jgi:Tfp pilus assembly protein FimT
MAIVAALAVPALSNVAATRRGYAARQVLRDLSFARERAMNTGLRSWVTFTTSSNSYSVKAEPAGSPGRSNAATLTDPATGSNYTQLLNTGEFSGVTIASAIFDAGSEVGFDWQGKPLNSSSASLSSNGVVTLTGGSTITVYAGTGLIAVP